MQNISNELKDFIEQLRTSYPSAINYTRKQVNDARGTNTKGHAQFVNDVRFKVSRGLYFIPPSIEDGMEDPVETPLQNDSSDQGEANLQTDAIALDANKLIPPKNDNFVPFGDYRLIKSVIESGMFYPVYITGESGNGKTEAIYQACAETGRELVRCNVTATTDEEDLIGGFRLQDGQTVWQHGPAADAMLRGAVLLLDEVNLGTEKMMCLQPVLEGKPIYVKKINQYIAPAPGFTVMATANTKGKGSADGRYIGSQILNEAFLDRFPICIEHQYPSKKIEFKILKNVLASLGKENADTLDFSKRLTEWAEIIRKTFADDAIDELITTRRLINIIKFYCSLVQNRAKAIEYNTNRFDSETKEAMLSLYQKVDESIPIPEELKSEEQIAAEKAAAEEAENKSKLDKKKLDEIKNFVREYNEAVKGGKTPAFMNNSTVPKDQLKAMAAELKKRGITFSYEEIMKEESKG